jgi:cysteine sulfinate desulfinase/cysteine desulfurase-like protein
MAMGRASSSARQHVRFSLGWSTAPAEIPAALEAFGQAVTRLRA